MPAHKVSRSKKASAAKSSSRTVKRRVRKSSKSASYKLSKQTKRNIKSGLTLFVLVIFSMLGIGSYFTYKKVFQPMASADTDSDTTFIQNNDIISLAVFYTDPLSSETLHVSGIEVYMLNTVQKEVHVFEIDTNVTVDLPGKYAFEELSKILAISNMIHAGDEDAAHKYAVNAVETLLGYPVDRYIISDKSMSKDIRSVFTGEIGYTFKSLKFYRELGSSEETNLESSELAYIYKAVETLNGVPAAVYSITDSVSFDYIDRTVQDITFDSSISLSGQSVAVLNASGYEGVATTAARFIKNIGGHVIETGNANQKMDESILVSNETGRLESRIKYLFDLDDVDLKNKIWSESLSDTEINRADVVLYIGVDTAQQL